MEPEEGDWRGPVAVGRARLAQLRRGLRLEAAARPAPPRRPRQPRVAAVPRSFRPRPLEKKPRAVAGTPFASQAPPPYDPDGRWEREPWSRWGA